MQNSKQRGWLGGLVVWASDFGSGHDLTVHGFKPCVWLCADSLEPWSLLQILCLCLSLPLPCLSSFSLSLSLCLSKINIKKIFKNIQSKAKEIILQENLSWGQPWQSSGKLPGIWGKKGHSFYNQVPCLIPANTPSGQRNPTGQEDSCITWLPRQHSRLNLFLYFPNHTEEFWVPNIPFFF